MSLPIIFGWGKNSKEIAYIGIHKCPNCKNYSHFTVREIANNIKVYFIPVAKFNKKRYLVCNKCEGGWEIDEDKANQFIIEATNGLDPNQTIELWNDMNNGVRRVLNVSNNYSIDNLIEDLKYRFGAEDYIDEQFSVFINSLQDDDQPK